MIIQICGKYYLELTDEQVKAMGLPPIALDYDRGIEKVLLGEGLYPNSAKEMAIKYTGNEQFVKECVCFCIGNKNRLFYMLNNGISPQQWKAGEREKFDGESKTTTSLSQNNSSEISESEEEREENLRFVASQINRLAEKWKL